MPYHRPPPALEHGEGLGDFGDRLLGRLRADDHHVGGIAHGEAIVLQVEQARGPVGQHAEAFAQLRRTIELEHIGVEIRHTDERAIAVRRRRVENVVGGERAFDPVLEQQVGIRHAADDGMVAIAAHEKKIGRRQHRDRDPGIGQAAGERGDLLRRQQRQLGHVTDHDAAATPVFFRELAHQVDIHGVGRGADIQVHVDVDVELARQLEDAADLAGLVAVVAWRAADYLRAALQSLDQQLLRSRIADQSLLREDTDFDIDRPSIVRNQRLHALETAHADAGIDLDLRAHARRSVLDALLQRSLGARANVVDRHALLQRRDALDGAQLAAFLRRAAIDDARLVEMDMRLDQTGTGEVAPGIIDLGIGGDAALDRDDATLLHADIQWSVGGTIEQAYVANDEIHDHSALMLAALISGHHFSISALWWAASASADCCSGGGISWPSPARRSRTVGSASASMAAVVSLRMASCGVPLGTHSPYQVEMYTPGAPASSTVGMSGAAASRLADVTA